MHSRLFLAACASVALVGAGACNNNGRNATDQTATSTEKAPGAATAAKGTSGTSAEQRPITLTGCLQKDGSDYILTQINEPPKGEPVAQQDLKEAEHAYRLDAKNTNDDNWPKMVGRQVRVNGTLAEKSDLDRQVGTSGSNQPKIHESDLAQVDVSGIEQVAASCGSNAAAKGARTGKSGRK